jgi:hypothetical protein
MAGETHVLPPPLAGDGWGGGACRSRKPLDSMRKMGRQRAPSLTLPRRRYRIHASRPARVIGTRRPCSLSRLRQGCPGKVRLQRKRVFEGQIAICDGCSRPRREAEPPQMPASEDRNGVPEPENAICASLPRPLLQPKTFPRTPLRLRGRGLFMRRLSTDAGRDPLARARREALSACASASRVQETPPQPSPASGRGSQGSARLRRVNAIARRRGRGPTRPFSTSTRDSPAFMWTEAGESGRRA